MSAVDVRVLGPLEVWIDDQPIELRRPKQRALLALLALRVGEVISTDRLVDELWGEDPPKSAVGSLQNLVSELRKALGPEVLMTRSPGYVLAVDPELVDSHRFERLLRESRERGAETLREALALWRGTPLAELASEPFVQAEVARLEELRAAAREELFDIELELGRHAQLVAELEAFVGEHPLRERPRGQLMLALYRSGRQADALEAYRHARETLVEELGLEPSSELQQLEQAILRHDPSVDLERPQAKRSREPERRKTVTILFADLVDFSSLAVELDPEVLRGVLNAYFDVVRTVVERHGGTVEKFIGDAAMAAFGIPELHEDDALRAVKAASELHDALAEFQSQHGVVLTLRVGLNTGEVFTADPASGESFATGGAVVLATRLQEAAQPGETLMGETTYKLVRDAATAEAIEPLDLVGGSFGRVPAFRLLQVVESGRSRGTAPLVGRDEELAWLRAAFAGACAERRSRVVTVLGEAGVGKTRLASELVTRLGEGEEALVGRCVSYGEGATFLPLAEIVRDAVPERPRQAIAELLQDDEQAHLVAERVTQLTRSAESVASMGEIFWAVRRFLEALALRRPLIVVLEDLHWAEPTLLDFVEYLDAWSADSPLLVVCLARPELLDQRPGWAVREKTLALEPLDEGETRILVAELVGDELADKASARILEVAEGNPLFIEQLLAFSEESGLDALDSVPPTLEALLAGRIDRLEPEERSLLDRGAVIGRGFERGAIVRLSPPDEIAVIDSRLRRLVRQSFLDSERGETFQFHHPLIREVAYGGMTKAARADLHERFGTWLEQREEGAEEIVGYHLEQAHRFRSELEPSDPALPALAKRAADELSEAGIRAWRRADTAATTNLLARATTLYGSDDPRRLEVMCELGIAQRTAGNQSDAQAILAEAAGRAEEIGDLRMLLRARMELAHLRLLSDRTADPTELVELVRQSVPIFEASDDDRALGRAWRHLGYVRGSLQGRCAEWLEAAQRALPYYRRSAWSASGCLQEIAAASFYGPTPVPQGIERCEQLLAEATDRVGRAHVLALLGGLHALAGAFEDSLALLAEAEEIYRDLGELYDLADSCDRVLGRVHLMAGDPEAAEQSFRRACEMLGKARDDAASSTLASELGEALYRQERHAEAASWSRFAESHAPAGDITAQFSWRALRGKVLANEGLAEDAEATSREAVEIVDRTDTLNHRGEVRLDLALVLASAGRDDEAASQIQEALELFKRKESVPGVRAAGSALAQLVHA